MGLGAAFLPMHQRMIVMHPTLSLCCEHESDRSLSGKNETNWPHCEMLTRGVGRLVSRPCQNTFSRQTRQALGAPLVCVSRACSHRAGSQQRWDARDKTKLAVVELCHATKWKKTDSWQASMEIHSRLRTLLFESAVKYYSTQWLGFPAEGLQKFFLHLRKYNTFWWCSPLIPGKQQFLRKATALGLRALRKVIGRPCCHRR